MDLFKQGKEKEALGRLGKGLHSLQDIFAHRNWDTGPLGTDVHPSWYDDWFDPKNATAAELTEEATKNYIKKYMRLTYGGYTH